MNVKHFYTVPEAARLLCITDATLRRWIEQGKVRVDASMSARSPAIHSDEVDRVRRELGILGSAEADEAVRL